MGETGDLHNVVEPDSGGVPAMENSMAVSEKKKKKKIEMTQVPIDR